MCNRQLCAILLLIKNHKYSYTDYHAIYTTEILLLLNRNTIIPENLHKHKTSDAHQSTLHHISVPVASKGGPKDVKFVFFSNFTLFVKSNFIRTSFRPMVE